MERDIRFEVFRVVRILSLTTQDFDIANLLALPGRLCRTHYTADFPNADDCELPLRKLTINLADQQLGRLPRRRKRQLVTGMKGNA